jgi:CheY-like chemotaxis protein/DNA-directed RNA polymerase specialized sigma24 family protein
MSIAQAIGPHIPYLRRFARALTGSQESGDAYVAALLESLIEDRSIIGDMSNSRVALYRAFCSFWQSVDVNLVADRDIEPGPVGKADRRLGRITPRARQAFLLVSVEDFTPGEVATILGVTADEASGLIDQAGTEIAEQVATDVLIIEDEPIISMDLAQMVKGLGHAVAAIARTRTEALAAAARHKPGLILADIQLADGSSGLDAVNDLMKSVSVPVIFITAYPERLLTGERPEPAFLITKPFSPDTVKAIISQALFFDMAPGEAPRTASA